MQLRLVPFPFSPGMLRAGERGTSSSTPDSPGTAADPLLLFKEGTHRMQHLTGETLTLRLAHPSLAHPGQSACARPRQSEGLVRLLSSLG